MQKGFTLLELLISLTIVSILSAVAVPQYQAYRSRAYDVRALSDLRAIALAEEAYFFDTESYLNCQQEACTNLPGIARLSEGSLVEVTTSPSGFTATASHPLGTGVIYNWNTEEGGLVEN
jgi:prepilin-type N-terminal cleavage/methylation domain-containing protein